MQRFKFQGGRLMKAGDGRDGDGWFPTEAEAREWARPRKRGEQMRGFWENPDVEIVKVERRPSFEMTQDEFAKALSKPVYPRIDWDRKWLAVKADLAERGFTGTTKAEAIRWARDRGMEVPQ